MVSNLFDTISILSFCPTLLYNLLQLTIVPSQARYSSVLPLLILGLCSIVGAMATFFLPETAGRWVRADQWEAFIVTIDQSQDAAPDTGGWVTIRQRSIQVSSPYIFTSCSSFKYAKNGGHYLLADRKPFPVLNSNLDMQIKPFQVWMFLY